MLDFITPSYEIAIQNIPRLFTAIAEWMGCAMFLFIFPRSGKTRTVIAALAFLILQVIIQLIDGILPLTLWLMGMLLAILAMFLMLYEELRCPAVTAAYLTAHAFLLAEFMASVEWQIYYYFTIRGLLPSSSVVMFSFMLVIYIPGYFLIYMIEKGMYQGETLPEVSKRELFIVLTTVLITFLFSNLSFVTPNTPFSSIGDSDIFNVRTLVDLGGLLLLYSYQHQRRFLMARKEADSLQNLLEKQYIQYRMSKDNVDLIDRKYHDLKHKIQLIKLTEDSGERQRYLQQMEDEIKRYEVELKTGNNVLDIILTSKNLSFKENGITFICIANGSLLSFMDTMDICSMLGNALDNAEESALGLSDKEKRIIRLKLFQQARFVILNIENSYDHDLEPDYKTTKKDEEGYHGFGLKSIEMTARKYGGTMSISADGGIFSLSLLFPVNPGKGQTVIDKAD